MHLREPRKDRAGQRHGDLARHHFRYLKPDEKDARAALPDATHVAVFDTAFHLRMPRRAKHYAIDLDLAERLGIRRYGFHGTSHAYVASQAARFLDREEYHEDALELMQEVMDVADENYSEYGRYRRFFRQLSEAEPGSGG